MQFFYNNKLYLVVVLFALFASIFSLQKITLEYAEPFFLIGFRMTISGFVLIFFEFCRKKNFKIIELNDIFLFILLALFNIYLNSIFEIWGLDNMTSSKACMLYSLSPFITALFSFFILHEKINFKKFLGMIIGFLGLIPLTFYKTYKELVIGNFFSFSVSEISLILSVFFSVIGWIILKKIVNKGYSFVIANGKSMFVGGILILIHSYIFGENWHPLPIKDINSFIIYTLITCFISNFICYNLFGYLLKYFSATFMTFSGLMTPFFASFFGYFFLKEDISYMFFISISLFFLGLMFFYNEELKNKNFIYKKLK